MPSFSFQFVSSHSRSPDKHIWTILKGTNAHFGFRTGRTIVRFINEAKASSGGALSVDDALDAQLYHKVLPKLRGEGEYWSVPLAELEKQLGTLGTNKRSCASVSRMRRDLDRNGSFHFWN